MPEINNFKNVNLAGYPEPYGLYDPKYEHDACGVGFVANIDGIPTHTIIKNAIQVSINLEHRGAIGSDKLTGDGGGLLLQIQDDFFRQICAEQGLELPQPGKYGVGMFFMPQDETKIEKCRQAVQKIVKDENCFLLGWRMKLKLKNAGKQYRRLLKMKTVSCWAGEAFPATAIPWENSAG